MPKARFYTTFAAGFCVFVIALHIHVLTPSFPNQQTYFAQAIAKQLDTSFSLELSNPNCSLSGYILVLKYAGQQGGGVKSLVSLQRWVKDVGLPMMIVEPFIQESVLGTYRKSLQEVKFSDMFDLENFNRVSLSQGLPELIPWETYVNCAPVRAVLVRIRRGDISKPPKVVWDARPGSSDCWQHSDEEKNITMTINKKRLCYIRVVDYFNQLTNSSIFSAREVRNIYLAGLEITAVNLVFDLWSMTWHIPGARPKPVSSYFYGLSASYVKNGSVFLTDNLQDSPRLLLDVTNYQNHFLRTSDSSSYVAVMLRIEYIIFRQRRGKGSVNLTQLQDFLDETVTVTTTVMTELGIKDVFVTADIGLYGSNTWKGTLHPRVIHNEERVQVEARIKHTVERLYKNKWTFEEWEKSFSLATGGVEERGYIAGLQRGIASRASCLIMVGGGSFQALTLKRYVDQTEQNKRCIRYVGTKRTPDVNKYALMNV